MTAKEMLNHTYGKINWDDSYIKPNYVRYTDTDIVAAKLLADKWYVEDQLSATVCPSVRYDISANTDSGLSDRVRELIDKKMEEKLKETLKDASRVNNNTDNKKENNMSNIKNTTTINPVKNVLFLAPGYQYAKSVVANQSKELDRKKIPYNASIEPQNFYIHTDKIHIEIVYMDPVKYTPDLFRNRAAVFGKKELVDKAKETFFHMVIFRPNGSLSKYIRELHSENVDPTAADVKPRETYIPEIKNVYFNNPMTVVLWEDGTKTMVRCQEDDVYSAETGLALCIAKKALGNMPNFNNVFRKWIPEELQDNRVMLKVEGVNFVQAMADGDFLSRFKDGIQRAFGREEV